MSVVPSTTRKLVSDSVDGLILGAAAALPWSTSSASVFIVLAILLLPFSTRVRGVALELSGAPGGLPAALVAFAAVGMFWSSATWPERLGAWDSYCKLLLIAPLLVHFRRSRNGPHIMAAYLVSCSILLLVAWTTSPWPLSPSSAPFPGLGVPVKSPGTQVREFLLAAIALLFLATATLGNQRRSLAAAMLAVSLAFLATALYMAAFLYVLETLTTLIVLVFVLGWHVRRSRLATGAVLFLAATTAVWTTVPRVHQRIAMEWQSFLPGQATIVPWRGGRGEFWQQSVGFISQAPLIGHGTGSTQALFRSVKLVDSLENVTNNPHQQTLAVGIQLGGCGMLLLWAMWLAHLRLFLRTHQLAWVGLVVTGQIIAGSLFDSLLFDFTEGWLYVLAIGVIGGTVTQTSRLEARISDNLVSGPQQSVSTGAPVA
jgi:O-antigen ligase